MFVVLIVVLDWGLWAGIGFVFGLAMMLTITEVVESCVVTLFVCLASDPDTLLRTKPDDYNMLVGPIHQFYPQAQVAPVHHGHV